MSQSTTPATSDSSCSSVASSVGDGTQDAKSLSSGSFIRRVLWHIRSLADSDLTPGRRRRRNRKKELTATCSCVADSCSDVNQLMSLNATTNQSHAKTLKEWLSERSQEWTVSNQLYDFKSRQKSFTADGARLRPKEMKFLIGFQEIRDCDKFGKEIRVVRRPAVSSLMDKVVLEFCTQLGMSQCRRLAQVQDRGFLWCRRQDAVHLLTDCAAGRQKFFLNFVPWDNMLTDLHCLTERLNRCQLRSGQVFDEHLCRDRRKINEELKNRYRTESAHSPAAMYVDKQFLCDHIYRSDDLDDACRDPDCANYCCRICSCFQLRLFLPETVLLTTKKKVEHVLRSLEKGADAQKRWLLRAPSLHAGMGVQLIDSAIDLQDILRYNMHKRLRGQFFILQRYLRDPLLLNRRRVDCRMFLLICVLTDRRVVGFLHPGYTRTAPKEFDAGSCEPPCHLTSSVLGSADCRRRAAANGLPVDYCSPYAEDAVKKLSLPPILRDTFDEEVKKEPFLQRLAALARQLVRSMEGVVLGHPGSWQVFGLDLWLDAAFRPWLYEVVAFPTRADPDPMSATQHRVFPAVLTEALAIAFELNQRDFCTRSARLWLDLPDAPANAANLIEAQQNFIWVYSTDAERLVSYKTAKKRPQKPWYDRWREASEMNDYALYIRNFRLAQSSHAPDTGVYGRRLFGESSGEQVRRAVRQRRRQADDRQKQ